MFRAKQLKRDLRPGDHIYATRRFCSHHGIYVGDNNVVHFTAGSSRRPGCDCGQGNSGVILCCLGCFLKGSFAREYKYGVSEGILFWQSGSSCTVAPSDPPDTVTRRAMHLLQNGFGKYGFWKKNSEDFALYCKTGFVVQDKAGGASGRVLMLGGRYLRYTKDIGVRVDKFKLPVEHIFPDAAAENSMNKSG